MHQPVKKGNATAMAGCSLCVTALLIATIPAQTFGPPIVTNVPSFGTRWVTYADLNRDGNPDLVAVNASFPNGQLAYHLGDGLGGFGPRQYLSTLFASTQVASADFNLDGFADLVVSNPSGQTAVHLGRSIGLLGPAVQILGVHHPLVVDVDQDGDPDLVGTGPNNAAQLRIVYGNGAGGFTTYQQWPLAHASSSLAAVDVDGDGRAEFVTMFNWSIESSYQLLRRDGAGFVLDPPVVVHQGNAALGGSVDFDEDGRQDLLVTVGTSLRWLRSVGNGFAPPVTVATETANLFVMHSTDFDGDGHADVLVGRQNSTPVSALGRGDGTLGPWVAQPDLNAPNAQFVDVTRDGFPDYVSMDSNTIETRSQSIAFHPGTTPFGAGSPACRGAVTIGTSTMPEVGNTAMRVRCANVPKGAIGLVFGGGTQNVGGYPGLDGMRLHTGQVLSITLGSGPVGEDGTFSVPMPVPNELYLRGLDVYLQGVFLGDRGNGDLCGGTPLGLVTTLGLAVVVQ